MSHFQQAVVLAIAALIFSGAAQADVILCNDFRVPIQVALASQIQGSFNAKGWFVVKRNACETVDFVTAGTAIYYTADSNEYREGGAGRRDHWGNKTKLFVPGKRFDLTQADQPRGGANPKMFGMGQIQANTTSVTLRFSAGNTAVTVKNGP